MAAHENILWTRSLKRSLLCRRVCHVHACAQSCMCECVFAILLSGESRMQNKFELNFEEEKWVNANVHLFSLEGLLGNPE